MAPAQKEGLHDDGRKRHTALHPAVLREGGGHGRYLDHRQGQGWWQVRAW